MEELALGARRFVLGIDLDGRGLIVVSRLRRAPADALPRQRRGLEPIGRDLVATKKSGLSAAV